MSSISDIVKFAILQVAVICSILLFVDIFQLSYAILIAGLDFSSTLKVMAAWRGIEIAGVPALYPLFSWVFNKRFSNLHLLAKEAICFIVLITICALYYTAHKAPKNEFVVTGDQTADYLIACAGIYLFIKVLLFAALWIEREKNPDGD